MLYEVITYNELNEAEGQLAAENQPRLFPVASILLLNGFICVLSSYQLPCGFPRVLHTIVSRPLAETYRKNYSLPVV